MTKDQYKTWYNTGTYQSPPYGEVVEAYAVGLLGHKAAAQTIRERVYERGFDLIADPDMASASELWPVFRNLTQELCIAMLALPEAENPLALPESESPAVPTTKLDVFYQLLREVPFDCKRVLLLTYLFEENPDQIGYILSKPVKEVRALIDRGNAELGVAFLRVPVS